MKRRVSVLSGLLAGILLLTYGGLASAHSFRTGTNVTTTSGEKINHTLFIAGSTVDVASEVDGDVFCAGQTVNISGTVHGDVLCAAQTITISGTVDGDVRLAGQTVTVSAKVAGNATVGSQTFVLSSGGAIGRDLTLGSTDATLDGNVGRDIAFGSNTATIDSEIGRDVIGTVQNLSLGSKAYVHGSLKYTSSDELHKISGAKVDGAVSRSQPAKREPKRGSVWGFGIRWFIYWLLALMLLTFTTALIAPRLLHETVQARIPWPWKPLLVGFVASFVVPVAFIIAAATFIGLPVAFSILFAWILIEILGIAFSGYYVGRLILHHSTRPLLIALAGSAVLAVLLFIPFIGIIVLMAAVWTGAGLVLLAIRDHMHKPVYNLSPMPIKNNKPRE